MTKALTESVLRRLTGEALVGRRLLSTALAEARSQGARRFVLGATPAGYRLYESLGFATRVVTKVWASGETHQA